MPRLLALAIDRYTAGTLVLDATARELVLVAIGIAVVTYFQAVAQTYASEQVARDLRSRLIGAISVQGHGFIRERGGASLLTNLTSDVDAVKLFVAQAVASLVASVFLIVGTSIMLLSINWRLALSILGVVPLIGITFFLVLRRVRAMFVLVQQAIDRLNAVITDTILGAALVRLMDAHAVEREKFRIVNAEARDLSLRILRLFAGLVPVIVFATNVATLLILAVGGRFVIQGSMSLGDFTAFNSYLAILIFPIILIGFMSNVMAQASASYQRIATVLTAAPPVERGTVTTRMAGDVAVQGMTLSFGEKPVLSGVSFAAPAGSRTAVIGPTAAGKTQLLYALARLVTPDAGVITYDGVSIERYTAEALHQQVALVFQDSVIFNLTLRENIAFNRDVTPEAMTKAIETAELGDFIASLPEGLDTVVAERGSSLSGGQKQRIMLARALALAPRVLLLDDFTARVDITTARRVLDNVHRNYPGLTLISVTQQIAPVEDYDQILLLMEGQLLASGRHDALLASSPEYAQIYDSQQSTSQYEFLPAR
jgi:ATP-binding cassette subfamily B protein